MATPVPLCTHVKPSGATCGSPAVSGTALCYHHSAIKSALARVIPLDKVPYGAHAPIPFVFPEDRASLQINLFLLLNAFNEKRIDQRTATIMHRVLRAMSANLGAKPLNENQAEAPAPHASAPAATPTSAPNPAPVAAPVQPNPNNKSAANPSPGHQQPAPRSTSEGRKPAPAPKSASAPRASQPLSLPESSHSPAHKSINPSINPSIDPSAAFSAAYNPSDAPAYPPSYPLADPTGRRSLGALSPEGQRIISLFSSQRD